MFNELNNNLLDFENQLFFHFKTIEVIINFNYLFASRIIAQLNKNRCIKHKIY